MNHELKIWPQYYARVADKTKTFEVRKNDRGFQSGDTVVLMEYNPEKQIDLDEQDGVPGMTNYGYSYGGYTGSPNLIFKIGFVLPIDAERVVFSLLPLVGGSNDQ